MKYSLYYLVIVLLGILLVLLVILFGPYQIARLFMG